MAKVNICFVVPGEMDTTGERRLEILLIEDNQSDVELFLNVVDWINMGDQVSEYFLMGEKHSISHGKGPTKTIQRLFHQWFFIDLKCHLMSGSEVLKSNS
jgi:hypothetical protein